MIQFLIFEGGGCQTLGTILRLLFGHNLNSLLYLNCQVLHNTPSLDLLNYYFLFSALTTYLRTAASANRPAATRKLLNLMVPSKIFRTIDCGDRITKMRGLACNIEQASRDRLGNFTLDRSKI